MLLDHFHPPLKGRRHWTGFHSHWASTIAADLNSQLPGGWFAEPQVQWGIEVDVSTFQEAHALTEATTPGNAGQAHPWEPPAPLKTIGLAFRTDEVEVRIHHDFGDVPLVGAIELVSPANKDRPETRDAFVSKCANYLWDRIGLVVLDVVTDATANMHALLMERLGDPEVFDDQLYVSAYRPVYRDQQGELDVWYERLEVGGSLPSVPLYLKDGPRVRVNFAETYLRACRELRLPIPANE